MPIVHIAATVGIGRRFVYKWAQRFLLEGLEGLADKPRHGHWPLSHQRDRRDQYDGDRG
jgi:transposase